MLRLTPGQGVVLIVFVKTPITFTLQKNGHFETIHNCISGNNDRSDLRYSEFSSPLLDRALRLTNLTAGLFVN